MIRISHSAQSIRPVSIDIFWMKSSLAYRVHSYEALHKLASLNNCLGPALVVDGDALYRVTMFVRTRYGLLPSNLFLEAWKYHFYPFLYIYYMVYYHQIPFLLFVDQFIPPAFAFARIDLPPRRRSNLRNVCNAWLRGFVQAFCTGIVEIHPNDPMYWASWIFWWHLWHLSNHFTVQIIVLYLFVFSQS